MLPKEKLDRINELARRAKTVGLTREEMLEQQQLRKEYIEAFRNNFINQLHALKIVDEKGNDITLQKLKESKKMRHPFIH